MLGSSATSPRCAVQAPALSAWEATAVLHHLLILRAVCDLGGMLTFILTRLYALGHGYHEGPPTIVCLEFGSWNAAWWDSYTNLLCRWGGAAPLSHNKHHPLGLNLGDEIVSCRSWVC